MLFGGEINMLIVNVIFDLGGWINELLYVKVSDLSINILWLMVVRILKLILLYIFYVVLLLIL